MNNEITTIGEQLFSMPPGSSIMVFGNGSGGYIKPSEKEKQMTDKLKVLQAPANIQNETDEFSSLDETSYNSEIVQAMTELRQKEKNLIDSIEAVAAAAAYGQETN